MKKTYINPSLDIIAFRTNRPTLLGGSGVKTGGTPGQGYTNTDVSYGHDDDFDW